MQRTALNDLYSRYATGGDLDALAQVFDHVAPDLQRLAHCLVSDRHRAEDLVQETFLTALEHPQAYEPARPVKPWLVGILVNRSRNSRRAAGRVLEPERLQQREPESPQQAVSTEEMRAALTEAIAELPRDVRLVVEAQLRGGDREDLAARLGISRGALRSRLHRGLLRLRSALPPGLATAFAALFLHSKGLARARRQILEAAARRAPALSSGATLGLAGAYMSTRTLLAVGLALATLVAVGVQFFLDAPVRTPAPDVAQLAASPGSIPAPEHGAANPALASGLEAQSPPGRTPLAPLQEPALAVAQPASATLRGIVFDEDERPVPGALVLAWNSRRDQGEADLRTTSGADGRFELEGLAGPFVISAETDSLACLRGLRGELPVGSSAGGLELRLAAAQTMRGRVLDPEGRPVAGAVIELGGGLNSRSPDDATSVQGVTTFAGGRGAAVTDEAGEFVVTGLPPRRLHLRVKAAPYLVYREYHAPLESPIEIELDPGLVIAGRVLDSSGRPAAGARVRRWPYWGNVHTVDQEVVTAEDGSFVLPSAMRGEEHTVAVLHEGHALQFLHPVEPVRSTAPSLRFALLPERVIAGRTVDTAGLPVAGVAVRVVGPREMQPGYSHARASTWEWAFDIDEVTTDEDGGFRFANLNAERYEVHAFLDDGQGPATVVEVPAGSENLELELDPRAARRVAFVGRVLDRHSGEPVPAFEITVWLGTTGLGRSFEAADGAFDLAGLAPGSIGLEIQAPGYASRKLEADEYGVGDHPLEVQLDPARSLEVTILDEAGAPHARGSLRAVTSSGETVVLEQPGTGLRSNSWPFEDGRATLHGLPATRLVLTADVAPFDTGESFLDLTHALEDPVVVVVPVRQNAELTVFVLSPDAGVDPEALARHWPARHTAESGRKLADMLRSTGAPLLDSPALLAVLADGELALAATTFEPQGQDGLYSIETHRAAPGGSSVGFDSEGPIPVATLTLPTRPLRIRCRAEGYADYELELDTTDDAGRERIEVIVLERL